MIYKSPILMQILIVSTLFFIEFQATYCNTSTTGGNFREHEPEVFDELTPQRSPHPVETKEYQNSNANMNLYQNFSYDSQESEEFNGRFETFAPATMAEDVSGDRYDNRVECTNDMVVGLSDNDDGIDQNSNDDQSEIIYHTYTPQGLSPIGRSDQPVIKPLSSEADNDMLSLSSTGIHEVQIHKKGRDNDCLLWNIDLLSELDTSELNIESKQKLSENEQTATKVTDEQTPYVKQDKISVLIQAPVAVETPNHCPVRKSISDIEKYASKSPMLEKKASMCKKEFFNSTPELSYSKASIVDMESQMTDDEGVCCNHSNHEDDGVDEDCLQINKQKKMKNTDPVLPELVVINKSKQENKKQKSINLSCHDTFEFSFDPTKGYLLHSSRIGGSKLDDGYSSNGNGSLPESPREMVETAVRF